MFINKTEFDSILDFLLGDPPGMNINRIKFSAIQFGTLYQKRTISTSLLGACILLLIVSILTVLYHEELHANLVQNWLQAAKITDSVILYPNSYPKEVALIQRGNKPSIRYGKWYSSPLTTDIINQPYDPYSFPIFDTLSGVTKNCDEIRTDEVFHISRYHILPDDFDEMFSILIGQIETEGAFDYLKGGFQNKLNEYLNAGVLHKHFAKFAGTSVWLQDHGVHLMISRVTYRAKGGKCVQFSLLYAQIFDRNWNELHNIDLVVPVRSSTGDKRKHRKINFPRFMPIPFFHPGLIFRRLWYGPEDCRLLMIRNEYNELEPIIIFNEVHRIPKDVNKSADDTSTKISYSNFRSMFIGWLFRYQLGKFNTDGATGEKYDQNEYIRVAELRVKNSKRRKTEKNWTPLYHEQEPDYLYIIPEWEKLTVLKCHLYDELDGVVTCNYIHKLIKSLPKLGKLRGGTELIPVKTQDPDRPTWIGFLRAKMQKCGCGLAMYRPQLAIITMLDDTFQVTHVSSFVSFNIPVLGWSDKQDVCGWWYNALIPNGLSMWEIDQRTGIDYLTLTLSAQDESNYIVQISGIDAYVKSVTSQSEKIDENYSIDAYRSMKECVLLENVKFCAAYAEKMKPFRESTTTDMETI